MFSDTHFHFSILREEDGWTRAKILQEMAGRGCKFALDIGTHCDDLSGRGRLFEETFSAMQGNLDAALFSGAKDMIYFSAGIWPAPEAISEREAQVKVLEKNIEDALQSTDPLKRKLVALGECGLDHHWNPSGADGRDAGDFDARMIEGEAELFEMQIELSKKYSLPLIVHSRDAFEGTYSCIKNSGCERGIIHCYSYGINEARAFLDLGFHISFSGSVTYAKKSKMEDMRALLAFVPDDRILLETDSPYLAPVPMRGHANNPNYIEHTYNFVAAARGISVESLCGIVERNSENLFKIKF